MSLDVLSLEDPSGSVARILPGFGFNCYSFETVQDGQRHEVLWSAPGFTTGTQRPSHSGIPILFPFPGRIAGNGYTFEGRAYQVEGLDDGRGNAIHGFVLDRPWQIVEHTATRAVGRFQASQADPRILDWWPSDFVLTVRYELSGNTLASELSVSNPGPGRLPFGLGTHAYFRLPLAEGSRADDCRITVPAALRYELEGMLPTGRTLAVAGANDLRSGLPFALARLDDMFTGLEFVDGRSTTRIEDPSGGRVLTLAFSDLFPRCVVYNPPHREAICIEPYTSIPDPFALSARGVDAGLRVLEPGESVRGSTELAIRAAGPGGGKP